MVGQLHLHDRRWRPVNASKNSNVTIQIVCSWSGKRFNVDDDELLGSTTLLDLVKRVKKDIPGLYLWDEVGGAVLVCGAHHAFQSEWDTTMICDLISDETTEKISSIGGESSISGVVPRVMLDDGREAVVITIGTPEAVLTTKPTVVQRCLAKGDVYG